MSAQAGEDAPPWDAWLRLATLRLGVAPADFWRLSLKEWLALTAAPPAPARLRRADFEALAAAHPDSRTAPEELP